MLTCWVGICRVLLHVCSTSEYGIDWKPCMDPVLSCLSFHRPVIQSAHMPPDAPCRTIPPGVDVDDHFSKKFLCEPWVYVDCLHHGTG
jgi:hypothetical protein